MSPSQEVWRYLPFSEDTAGRQLALSESLLQEGLATPACYWYVAHQPALILGAAQKLEVLDLAKASQAGYTVYKRTSGGATVRASADFLSFDIAVPPTSSLWVSDITKAYAWLGQIWLLTLRDLGVSARLLTPQEARASRAALEETPEIARLAKLVCFGTLSAYEVVDEHTRKIVGLAQIRRRWGSLFQCGIPLHWSSEAFSQQFNLSSAEQNQLAAYLDQHVAGLSDLLDITLNIETVIATFEKNLRQTYPIELKPSKWSEAELAIATQLQGTKFLPVTSQL